MDSLIRSRRRFLSATTALTAAFAVASASTVVACGASRSGALAGVSDRPAGGAIAPGTRDAGAIDGASALPTDYRTKFTKVNKARFVSSGHAAGRWDVDIYANEAARKALAARARDVPVGAMVVEEHFEKSGAGGP